MNVQTSASAAQSNRSNKNTRHTFQLVDVIIILDQQIEPQQKKKTKQIEWRKNNI